MDLSSDDEPIAKRKRPSDVTPYVTRYEQISRHRAAQANPKPQEYNTKLPGSAGSPYQPTTASSQAPTSEPPTISEQALTSAPTTTPDQDIFYNCPTETIDPRKQHDADQRAKEQAATNQFLEGLRRAVVRHLYLHLPSPTPPLPHYAYNNTTRELARLHGYPHYHQSQPNSKLDSSLSHIDDNLEYHVCLYEHQIIREEKQKLATIKQKLATMENIVNVLSMVF